jgi:hypothetical protein
MSKYKTLLATSKATETKIKLILIFRNILIKTSMNYSLY